MSQTISQSLLTRQIKLKAEEEGFDLVGISPATRHDHVAFFEDWLKKGYAATMEWLGRGRQKRGDPSQILEGAKTIISCGLSYYRGHPFSKDISKEGHGWISNYAWGDDYHGVVLEKLEAVADYIICQEPRVRVKSYVDTGPILERSYAASAGLGWIGKNTCLINTRVGSFFFIGEILTDLELVADTPTQDHCGSCTRCLDACPTQALTPYEMDASRCISYLTIEHRGEISTKLRDKMGAHIDGCDICQDVCPWNQDVPLSRDVSFDPRPGLFNPKLESLKSLTQEDFSRQFRKSVVKRIQWKGMQRNIEIAEGHWQKSSKKTPINEKG